MSKSSSAPKTIQRDWPLPHLRDSEAPAGFRFCAICKGYQHPRRHDPTWGPAKGTWTPEKPGDLSRADLLATYAKAPAPAAPKANTNS